MNKVILSGRLTRDVSVKYTSGEEPLAVLRNTIAVDRIKKDETDFINIVAFGKTAEFMEKYMNKGMRIIASGRWQTGSYDKEDGTRVHTNDCIIENVEFAESKKKSEETDDGFEDIGELPF